MNAMPWRAARLNRAALSGRPLLLTSAAAKTLEQHAHPNLGRLVQPRAVSNMADTAGAIPWAADNDCFQGLAPRRYYDMLDKLQPHAATCLFATVPDVVGDAVATAHHFERWAEGCKRRGLPAALVAQDGLEELDRWLAFTWHRIDALFIGGTTEWKLGEHARRLAQEAHDRGLWVHWGRVNSKRRYDYIVGTGACDSFDGSSFSMFRRTHLDKGLAWTCGPVQHALDRAVSTRGGTA